MKQVSYLWKLCPNCGCIHTTRMAFSKICIKHYKDQTNNYQRLKKMKPYKLGEFEVMSMKIVPSSKRLKVMGTNTEFSSNKKTIRSIYKQSR